ncbi:MAG: diacylglycerol kinase family protein [Bacteroidia bacterium]|nr:diacylglycerol kinase family protein [Bacteroidia bacterium]
MFPKNYVKSFGNAFIGFKSFFKVESNAYLHSIAGIIVIVSGIFFKIELEEWLWLILAITLVFLTEMFNSAIEELSNLYSTEINPKIKIIKDISAAAVLIATFFAIIIGVIIFKPYLF